MPTTLPLPTTADMEVPSWKSPNELIHERINFDDTIWGFGLAGGAYYKTPLRITYVRPGSRAQMAHIYPGDVVLKINGIDSSTLTLDEAHRMILESGIHLKINVTSPEDLEDNYYCYQDPLEALAIEELKAKEVKYKATERFPKVLGKCSHWGLQWPWKCKRKIIYKESNCYLVPSKFEEKHKDSRKPEVKDDSIVLDSIHNVKGKKKMSEKQKNKNSVHASEKHKQPSDNIDTKEENQSIEQLDSVNKNDVKDQNNLVTKDENGNVTEKNVADDNNTEDDVKELNDTADKSNTHVVTKQNISTDDNPENGAKDLNDTADKNTADVVTEENGPADNNTENHITEQNTIVDNNNDLISEDNTSLNKVDEDIIIQQNTSVDINDENLPAEVNSSLDKNNENLVLQNDVTDQNGSLNENNNDNIVAADDKSSDDVNIENGSTEASDSIETVKTNSDGVKFENGDIPDISESEKHSR